MNATQQDRRAHLDQPGNTPSMTSLIQRGMLLQRDTGTISAIEFMKSASIGSSVIARVLSNHCVRLEDAQAVRREARFIEA